MMKKAITIFLLIAVATALFAACSQKETDEAADGATGTKRRPTIHPLLNKRQSKRHNRAATALLWI